MGKVAFWMRQDVTQSFWMMGIKDRLQSFKTWWAIQRAGEAGRYILWAPLAFGLGIWLVLAPYFQSGIIPTAKPILALLFMLGAMVIWAVGVKISRQTAHKYAEITSLYILPALALVAIGHWTTHLRLAQIDAPILASEEVPLIEGHLMQIQYGQMQNGKARQRLVIRPYKWSQKSPENMPRYIRVNHYTDQYGPVTMPIGSQIRVLARLRPPPQKSTRRGYDYAWGFYTQSIGAVGSTQGQPLRLTKNPRPVSLMDRASFMVENWRHHIRQRIIGQGDDHPQAAAIAVALVTGQKGELDALQREDMQIAGLAHMLAISGLHMGLVMGLSFILLRFIMSLWPRFTLDRPIKKYAAFGAICIGFFYLLLSGSALSAQRAFVMSGVMFLAIILDRRAISMRNVALAALVILAITPEAILQASFHLSFAAVIALIAAYEFWQKYRYNVHGQKLSYILFGDIESLFHPWRKFFIATAMTSLISSLATAPFTAFHFQQFSIYGVFANLLAMPILVFWVMPMIILAMLLMPFGADAWLWGFVFMGIDLITDIAAFAANLPMAKGHVLPMPITALLCFALGGLMLCLLRMQWRLSGLLVLGVGLIFAITAPQPIIQINRDASNIFVQLPDESYALWSRRKDRFTANMWLQQVGLRQNIKETTRLGPQVKHDKKRAGQCVQENKKQYCYIPSYNIAITDDASLANMACTDQAELLIILDSASPELQCDIDMITPRDHLPIDIY